MPVDDAYTVALLHMDGPDASATFTDESGKVWTVANQAQIDTAQSKFGGASGLFDGNEDYIYTPAHVDFDFGSGNFTIDFWVRSTQTTAYVTLVARNNDAGGSAGEWTFLTSSTSAGDIAFWSYDYNAFASAMLVTAENLFNTGDWVHIALVRSANDWTIYVNGVSKATRNSNTTLAAGARALYVGDDQYFHAARAYAGWMDEVRISKGIARWTANFTPPNEPYGLIKGTPVATTPCMMI